MFNDLHIIVKSWILSNIVMKDFPYQYLGYWLGNNCTWNHSVIKNKITRCLVIETEKEMWFSFSGTRSWSVVSAKTSRS